MAEIRNRIKELRQVKASELKRNPKNWRTHPLDQREALEGILSQIGYADALIARETPDGLELVDGHLRAETTPDAEVPVLVLDINEKEADLMLATFDPLASMAGLDALALNTLMENIEAPESLNSLLNAVVNNYEALTLDMNIGDFAEEYAGDESAGLDSQFEIVITCNGEQHQRELLERLTVEGLVCRSLIS